MQLTPVRSLGQSRKTCAEDQRGPKGKKTCCAHTAILFKTGPRYDRGRCLSMMVNAPMVAACAKRRHCHDWLERELPITCMLKVRATGPLCCSTNALPIRSGIHHHPSLPPPPSSDPPTTTQCVSSDLPTTTTIITITIITITNHHHDHHQPPPYHHHQPPLQPTTKH